jgi:phosphotransferase system  glucose/maltose/N-acetylglucosamine-specific IIC component
MCLLSTYNKGTFDVIQLFTNETFIDTMVYLYISFLILYFILVPTFDFLYRRQKADEKKALA